MAISVLLVTPSEGFGELIRQTLEDEGGYQVVLVKDGRANLPVRDYALAILDFEARDTTLLDLGRHLLTEHPAMRLIVVPPNNNPHHQFISNLTPHGYLTKPFYLPDLLGLIETTLHRDGHPSFPLTATAPQREPDLPSTLEPSLAPASSSVPPTNPALPPWLQDVNRAAQHLTRLSLETAAQAALITQGEQLYAYAGGYPQDVARELADAVIHYWGRQGGIDLARFIRLETTGEEYMLYATALPGGMVLSLVFDAKTPFSQIRSQASQLAQKLAAVGSKEEGSMSLSPADSQPIPVPPKTETAPLPRDWFPPQTISSDAFDAPAEDIPSDWQPIQPPSGERRSFLEQLLPDLLPSAPLPYEDEATEPSLGKTRGNHPLERDLNFLSDEDEDATLPSTHFTEEDVPPYQAETRPSYSQPPQNPPQLYGEEFLHVEPVLPSEPTQALYNLSFACVMLPRFPHHHLTSDLAVRIGEWIPQICVAFGWRVEHLAIRPEYVQFMVNVPPATSPGYLMRIITKVTSQRVFSSFPRFQDENPSGEFWAPGYLILSSTQLPPHRMVKDFITQTRKRQGFK
ncbi:MAG: IS200/IS605 family transposase [Anaerolineales bacterium]|nr:IS200/IS605 family transposase [Anaerolineales bacterium]